MKRTFDRFETLGATLAVTLVLLVAGSGAALLHAFAHLA